MQSMTSYDKGFTADAGVSQSVKVGVKNDCCHSIKVESTLSDKDNPPMILQKGRWLVLLSYCLLTVSAGSSWLCFPAVSNIMRKYYSIGILSVNLLSIIFGIAIVIFSLPFAAVLEKFGLGFTLKVAALLNAIGASLRYFGSNQEYGYWFLLFGNMFTAASVAGFLFLPGKIAVSWFSENEIGKVTSACIAFDAFGTGLGFLHATYMIRNHANKFAIEDDLDMFLLSQLIPALVIFFVVLVCVKDQPKFPPNLVELKNLRNTERYRNLLQRQKDGENAAEKKLFQKQNDYFNLKRSMQTLFGNYNFHLIVHMQGIIASIESIFEILLNEMLIDMYPGKEQSIGILGFVAVVAGFGSNIFVGFLVDITGSYKKITFFIFVFTMLCCLVWTILMQFVRSFFAKSVVYCLLMSISTSYYTIAFTHSSTVAYPVPPAATGVLLVLTSQIYDTTVSFIATECLNFFGVAGINGMAVALSFLSTGLSLMLKDHCVEQINKV